MNADRYTKIRAQAWDYYQLQLRDHAQKHEKYSSISLEDFDVVVCLLVDAYVAGARHHRDGLHPEIDYIKGPDGLA